MYDKPQDIAALISSRICHDMASPLGAISNGLELLELSGISPSPELALINDSIDSATARIQFFRIAFRHAAPDASIGFETLRDTTQNYFSGQKIYVDWKVGESMSRKKARLCTLLMMCLETAAPSGGAFSVKIQEGELQISCDGKLRFDPDVWNVLGQTEKSALPASLVHFEITRSHLAHSGKTLIIDNSDNRIDIRVS